MPYADWLPAVVLIVVGFNGIYAIAALSVPPREDWLYYVELQLPVDVALESNPDTVASNLQNAGYNVSIGPGWRGRVVNATRDGDPNFRSRFSGLGQDTAWVSVDIRCHVRYPRDDCPPDAAEQLRAHLAEVARDAGLAVDASLADFGDYDFASFDMFFLFMGQLLIAFVSVVVLITATLLARRPDPPHRPPAFPPMLPPAMPPAPPPHS